MKWVFIRDCITLSIFLVVLVSFTSCGDTLEVSKAQITQVNDDLDSVYHFPLGGIVEVNQDQYNRVSILMNDYLTSINPETNTYGEHPRTSINDRFLNERGLLLYSVNVNYTSGDLETDLTGSNVTGTKRTDFTFQFIDNKLHINIKIFESQKNSNVNTIIVNRTLIGER